MKEITALVPGTGWKAVGIEIAAKLQKTWTENGELFSVEAWFGTVKDRLTIIMNVSVQGAGAKRVIDDNCDVWENIFTATTKEDGNEFYKFLKKHGFVKVTA